MGQGRTAAACKGELVLHNPFEGRPGVHLLAATAQAAAWQVLRRQVHITDIEAAEKLENCCGRGWP